MADIAEHYQSLLAKNYSWLFGGLENGIEKNLDYFKALELTPRSSGIVIDLGAGSGFQSIPLAKLNYTVIAIDLSEELLSELVSFDRDLKIRTIQGDLTNFAASCSDKAELIVCMGDTLTHLSCLEKIERLFFDIHQQLEVDGKLILSFRDYSNELVGCDRFIPVKNEKDKVFTCYLEYEPSNVKVHDLLYTNVEGKWKFEKSFYRKLRLSPDWVAQQLNQVGFDPVAMDTEKGLVTIIAAKRD